MVPLGRLNWWYLKRFQHILSVTNKGCFNLWKIGLVKGTVKTVKLCMKPGPKGSTYKLFYGTFENLTFDPRLSKLNQKEDLMGYNANLGRNMLNRKNKLKTNVFEKWKALIPINFKIDLKEVWQ